MPLAAQISLSAEISHQLKIKADKVKTELENAYPAELCNVVLDKLHTLLTDLRLPSDRKGLAIFVSPIFQKMVYLRNAVQERIVIDESFEIRDLVADEQEAVHCLLLTLNGTNAQLFLVEADVIKPIDEVAPFSIDEVTGDTPQRVANFSDPKQRKQLLADKFLYHVDKQLDQVLTRYAVPLMVLTTEKLAGHYKKLTRHSDLIIGYATGYQEHATLTDCRRLIQPQLNEWKLQLENQLLDRVSAAADAHILITGIEQIWKACHAYKSGSLVVERNFRFEAKHGASPEVIESSDGQEKHLFTIKDAVDDLIETVIKNHGKVAFTADDSLLRYGRMALISDY